MDYVEDKVEDVAETVTDVIEAVTGADDDDAPAPTEGSMAPTEESMVPTEESSKELGASVSVKVCVGLPYLVWRQGFGGVRVGATVPNARRIALGTNCFCCEQINALRDVLDPPGSSVSFPLGSLCILIFLPCTVSLTSNLTAINPVNPTGRRRCRAQARA